MSTSTAAATGDPNNNMANQDKKARNNQALIDAIEARIVEHLTRFTDYLADPRYTKKDIALSRQVF